MEAVKGPGKGKEGTVVNNPIQVARVLDGNLCYPCSKEKVSGGREMLSFSSIAKWECCRCRTQNSAPPKAKTPPGILHTQPPAALVPGLISQQHLRSGFHLVSDGAVSSLLLWGWPGFLPSQNKHTFDLQDYFLAIRGCFSQVTSSLVVGKW